MGTEVARREHHPDDPDGIIVLNDSDAPDQEVLQAVRDYMTDVDFVESAAFTPPPTSAFQLYATEGNLLSRRHWTAPTNVIDEIRLARELAEDDIIAGSIGQMLAAAFKGRMRHLHEDERTEVLFDKAAAVTRLDHVFAEMYREMLITSQVVTVSGFTTENLQFVLEDSARLSNQSVICPRIGVMPAEHVRIKGSDLMGMGRLCYKPSSWPEEQFLAEYFDPLTPEPRRRAMRALNPFLTTLLVDRVPEDIDTRGPFADIGIDASGMNHIYPFNPRMVHRTTFAKGAAKYPRPLLTGNFALLEAKRLLNVMDYALLQGGSNYIVVAKKGTDQKPAKPNEVKQLARTVQMAGKTGVIVGDHRLSIEILTPDLEALLNPDKRNMVDRKLAARVKRIPDQVGSESAEQAKNEMEILQAVVQTDRDMLMRHVENFIYDETVNRNGRTFPRGAASIWFPMVVLSGLDIFLQGLLKLRDRGDIPRSYGVEFFGFDMRAAVRERARERSRGDDRIMTPPVVPHDSPANRQPNPTGGAPADNGPGRPIGARDAPGVNRGGEKITAIMEGDDVVRVGEVTYRVLEQHRETKRDNGRITTNERALLDQGGGDMAGVSLIPVNTGDDYEVGERLSIVRLRDGIAMICGRRIIDRAIVAKALVFNRPDFTDLDIQETALRWGFELEQTPEPEPAPSA